MTKNELLSTEILDTIPVGISSFSTIRNHKKLYIDKSGIIADLAKNSSPMFFSRPRRFGKSLLLSTISSLFSRGVEDFRGLKAESIWNEQIFLNTIC